MKEHVLIESSECDSGRSGHWDTFVPVAKQVLRIARCDPRKPAVADRLSYGELIRRSAILASHLRRLCQGNCAVAVCTDDPSHLAVAALAAWAIKLPYLPIDPSGPAERIRYMLTQADVKVVVTEEYAAPALPRGQWQQIQFNEADSTAAHERSRTDDTFNFDNLVPEDIAYIIFTSGSTGQPKGVAVTHKNLAHLVDWYRGAFRPTSEDRIAQLFKLTFDAAVSEIWPALSAGATLYHPDRSTLLDPELLRDYLVRQNITVAHAPTALTEKLLHLEWPPEGTLRYLHTGGDKLRVWPRPELTFDLVNNYGPTECTVIATYVILKPGTCGTSQPTIGRPIARTNVYIVDQNLKFLADGERGQICISGDGVAAGYIGRPDLTREQFVEGIWPGAPRMYLTGDLGRKLSTGEIEFCGRVDDQVKLRGYRIEPAEIVDALRTRDGVLAAEVIALGEGEDKKLVAYLTLTREVSAAELRLHLSTRIPYYMIPQHYVRLATLPITPNGKVDRAALPAPTDLNSLDISTLDRETHSETERMVIRMISELLGGQVLQRDDNFFMFGGHSLLAAQIISRIWNIFEVEVPLPCVFASQTVRALAREIDDRVGSIKKSDSVLTIGRTALVTNASLVPIQPKGQLPPFYCIHSAGGTALNYSALGRLLAPDQPVFGLQPDLSWDSDKIGLSVPAMASFYVSQIQRHQPNGPYYLGGHSFGGAVAFEMAQQLRIQGQETALLVLIDSYFPGDDYPFRGASRPNLGGRLDFLLGKFVFLQGQQRMEWIRKGLFPKMANGNWKRRSDPKQDPRFMADVRAYQAYEPKPYEGRIAQFLSRDTLSRTYHDSRLAWCEFAQDGFELYAVPGNHESLLNSPNVEKLAHELKSCLRRNQLASQNSVMKKT